MSLTEIAEAAERDADAVPFLFSVTWCLCERCIFVPAKNILANGVEVLDTNFRVIVRIIVARISNESLDRAQAEAKASRGPADPSSHYFFHFSQNPCRVWTRFFACIFRRAAAR